MKTKIIITTLAMLALASTGARAVPIGTEFTYQGRLTDVAGPPSGAYDFTFTLHLAASGGVPIVTVTNLNTAVANGLFTATVDFGGGIYNGNAYWISLGVRSNGVGGSFTPLTPRQPLTPTPNASYASLAGTVPGGSITSAKLAVDSVTVFALQNNAVTAAKVAAGQLVKSVNGLRDDVVLSAGPNVTITPSGNTLTIAGSSDWKLGGNVGTSPGVDFVGTADNQALQLKVNNTIALQFTPGTTLPNVVGGLAAFRPSVIASGVSGAVIAGGNAPSGGVSGFGGGDFQAVYDNDGTVGGGFGNKVGTDNGDVTDASFATVAGGVFNGASGYAATIGGGDGNQSGGSRSVVAGGFGNVGVGDFSSIGGGLQNAIQIGADYSSIGGGQGNSILPNASHSTIAGGTNNLIQSGVINSTIGGGLQNTIKLGTFGTTAATIAGGAGNTIQTQDPRYASIGGGYGNIASEVGSTVGGGYQNTSTGAESTVAGGYQNPGSGGQATVAGGFGNTSSGQQATVGGGQANTSSAGYATVGGGSVNTSSGFGATVSGGANNSSTRQYATVGGGGYNTSTGYSATVPGGNFNSAAGDYSFAAGNQAQANHQGSFVWADSTFGYFASTANDQFCVRAGGGVRLSDTTPNLSFGSTTRQMLDLWGTKYGIGVQSLTTYFRCDNASANNGFIWYRGGVHNDGYLNPGAGGTEMMHLISAGLYVNGAIVLTSDRNAKENFAPVSPREVLDKVAALPISRWNYKADKASDHLGPMAQDFYAAFGVGPDDKHIATVDADGVALAAIQGLNQKLEQKLEQKETEITELKARMEKLERLVNQKNGWAR